VQSTSANKVEGPALQPGGLRPSGGDRGAPRLGAREERSIEICESMIDVAAALFNVSGKELRKPGRSTLGVSRVRQIAMYVAHVTLQLNMTDIGRGFGRDRTTVVHACHLVEDLRDDEDFDRMVAVTERVASAAFGPRMV
jgi:hypothetical protein